MLTTYLSIATIPIGIVVMDIFEIFPFAIRII